MRWWCFLSWRRNLSTGGLGNNDVVRGVWLAVGSRGTQHKTVAATFVLIGLVPGVNPNNGREVIRVQMINEFRHSVSDDKESAFTLVRLQRSSHCLHLRSRPCCFF